MALPEGAAAEPTCYRHPGRRTLVRCSSCDRPICTSCMVSTPVGIRCPECAGRTARQRVLRPRAAGAGARPVVTVALLAINVFAFFVLERAGIGSSYGFREGALTGAGVADGQWWRVVTAAFLHANLLHLGFNMYALWLLGARLESYLGSLRFSVIYLLSGVSGSAGALLLTSAHVPTVGASGAIFGLLGAMLMLERQGVLLIGPVAPLLLINLVLTFGVPGISIGGHLGGLVGGVLSYLALARLGRGHVAYGRLGLLTPLLLLAILGLDAAVIAVAVG